MKKILLKNLHIINPCSDHALVENAYVAIYGDTIESVSSGEPAGEFDLVIDNGSLAYGNLKIQKKLALPILGIIHHPITVERMRGLGCTVHEFFGDHICYPGSGGPTCLTRPICRKY